MGKEILTFDDTEIEKNNLYRRKAPILLKDRDIEKVLPSNKMSSNEKTINALLVTFIMIIKLSDYL